MIFLILFQQGSDLGGLLVVVIGICGVLLRWVAAPAMLLLVITYFMWTPLGIPGDGYYNPREIEQNYFGMVNILLVVSVLVYMACQFRLLGLVHQAMAHEGAVRRKDEPPTRRPPSLIRPSELAVMFAVSAVVVLVGHLIWWFVNSVEVAPAEDFPLEWAGSNRGLPHDERAPRRDAAGVNPLRPAHRDCVLRVPARSIGVRLLAAADDGTVRGRNDPARWWVVGDEPGAIAAGEVAHLGAQAGRASGGANQDWEQAMTFSYWTREIAGWVLILTGLFFFVRTYDFLLNKRIFEAGPMAFIGFIVFRGGIHVLKVAVAAQAARSLPEAARPAARRMVRATARPVGPTPAKAVLPGPKTGRPTGGRS